MTIGQIVYRQRKNAGLCPACGKVRTAGTGHVICEACRAAKKAHQNARHDRCRAAKVCAWCGASDERTQVGKLYCLECEAKRSTAAMCTYDNDVYNHRCTRCHKPLPEGYTKQKCADCLAQYRERYGPHGRRRNGSGHNV